MDDNPFASLFKNNNINLENTEVDNEFLLQESDDLAERIFLITIDTEEHGGNRATYLPSICAYVGVDEAVKNLTETLSKCLRIRLSYENPNDFLLERKVGLKASQNEIMLAAEPSSLIYLSACFERLEEEKKKVEEHLNDCLEEFSNLIILFSAEVLIFPEKYFARKNETRKPSVHEEFIALIESWANTDVVFAEKFLDKLISGIVNVKYKKSTLIDTLFQHTVNNYASDIKNVTIDDPTLVQSIKYLSILASSSILGVMIINNKYPQRQNVRGWQIQPSSLMEELLMKTGMIISTTTTDYLYFERISTAQRNSEEESALHNAQGNYHDALAKMYKRMFKHEQSKEELLIWIGNIVEKHAFLSKLWPHQQVNPTKQVLGTDALFFNLSSVLLRICQPFCVKAEDEANQKFLKIKPSYCGATGITDKTLRLELGVHVAGLDKDTCLVPLPEDTESIPNYDLYNFITECFFLTHRCLYLSCHGLLDKFYRSSRQLNHMERLYADVRSFGGTSDAVTLITEQFERGMRVYLSTKASLTDPTFIQLCANFHVTTVRYLCQIAETDDMSEVANVTLPYDKNSTGPCLSCNPEFLIENLVDFIVFLNRYARPSLNIFDYARKDIILMVSIYMGNKSRMANPHLRATLTDILSGLLLFESQDSVMSTRFNAKQWLEKYPYAKHLTTSVMQLCVDMEISRDELLSYQKFGFRRTLYKILKIMWQTKTCKTAMMKHVQFAYNNIENPAHPLFLSFVNIILNDITYLLDEAMESLISIKDAERARGAGEWDELNDEDKKQKEAKLEQDIDLAKYYNTLANLTLETLMYMSSNDSIKSLLCHPVLVERVTLMINDFLLKLVGPKMGALRITDFSRCNFEPKRLVTDICTIYTNMSDRDDFCQAIVRDGRSYDDKFLSRALRVLSKIGNSELLEKFNVLAEKCKSLGVQEEEEEEIFADAPEDFYDELTYTIMSDPVTLPTSRKVVDRSTISRHLLGDTTDPFNRQPLTMEQVIPNEEIKLKIFKWREDWKSKKMSE